MPLNSASSIPIFQAKLPEASIPLLPKGMNGSYAISDDDIVIEFENKPVFEQNNRVKKVFIKWYLFNNIYVYLC